MNVSHAPLRAQPLNFVAHLRSLAAQRPDDTALIVVASGAHGEVTDTVVTWSALSRRVRALAAALQRQTRKGDRALLLLDNDDHYVVAFLACLHAGVTAVPVFPPESTREQHLARLKGIAADAQARCILSQGGMLARMERALATWQGIPAIAVDAAHGCEEADWRPFEPADGDIAFLQYTSGSTSAPKGVMISHGALMANERAIEEGLGVGDDDVFVSWLPLFHDMGLIGGMLQPLHRGIPLVLMSPRFFLEQPMRWLEAIARHRGTISGGPDFAYRLCVERAGDAHVAALDLSRWKLAFSGAEPVRHDTLAAFAERFAPAGFGASALYPCYGLAEATLFVTGGRRGDGVVTRTFSRLSIAQGRPETSEDGITLVACGRPARGHGVRIADASSHAALDDGQVGEIWARGDSLGRGYWNNAEASHAAFVEQDGQRWLRTGDLGFVHEGQLYITGRMKDLIIVRGHNLYPQDIERAVEDGIDAVRKGRVAAFAVQGPDGEGIGVAAEVSRGMQKLLVPGTLIEALRQTVSEACGQAPSVVVLLQPGALPKTSSGKLQRGACARGWHDGSLDAWAIHAFGQLRLPGADAGEHEAATGVRPPDAEAGLDALEASIAAIWQEVLGQKAPPGKASHFFTQGGNSLAAAEAALRLSALAGVTVPPAHLFEHPVLADCARQLRAMMDARPAQQASATPRACAPVSGADPADGTFALTHGQRRQWILWRMDPSSAAYHVGARLALQGPLDTEALRGALAGLVTRHAALRTVFTDGANAEGRLRVRDAMPVEMPVADLRALASDAREAELARLNDALIRQPFDLREGPLLRAMLAMTGQDEHLLMLAAHHIVADGASLRIMMEELGALYRQRISPGGQAGDAHALPAPHVDHAAWETAWLDGGVAADDLAYWRARLGTGEQPVLALHTDHPRPQPDRAGQAGVRKAAWHTVDLPQSLADSARACQATPFMLALAALQVVLHRHTGQPDIRVGVPMSQRTRPEMRAFIGFFVNTLVIQGRLAPHSTLTHVLDGAKRALLEAQAHAWLPFDQVVEAVAPRRDASRDALFQVLLNHVPDDIEAFGDVPGLRARAHPSLAPDAQFDLTVELRSRADGRWQACLGCPQALFEPDTITRLARHFTAVVASFAAHPAQAVGDLPMLDAQEQAALIALGAPRDTVSGAERSGFVHQAIARQAARTPRRVALCWFDDDGTGRAPAGQAMDFGTLDTRANQLARRLIKLGIGPETRVGIAMERSAAMVIGLLAVLKAGGAYVPMDPALPPGRMRHMMEDSGILLLLTDREGPSLPGLPAGVTRLAIDADTARDEAGVDPAVALHPEHPAYVIYTSGSTGRPKGVVVRHGALANFLDSMRRRPGLSRDDILVATTSLSFDIAGLEIYLPLMVGAELVLASRGDTRDGAALSALLGRSQATAMQATPAGWRLLLAGGWQGPARGKPFKALCGGEALHPDLSRALRDTGAALWNMYGPTETTVWSSTARVDDRAPSIGEAISGTQLLVLDEGLEPAPRGTAGELCIGGDGLARGYWARAGLTAERFIAHALAGSSGRIYRTGDLVRWTREGTLEYLGRLDHQVKVRGHRIELGEIEAHLLAQPGVGSAVVVALRDAPSDRLVAYVTPRKDGHVADATLREALSHALPDYMVPAQIVVMAALPLNHNGKVDRHALPAPTPDETLAFEAPQGHREEVLAAVWRQVLGTPRAGRQDNFFACGGDSILILKMAARLAEHGLTLHPRQVFEHQTLQALAGVLATQDIADRQGAHARCATSPGVTIARVRDPVDRGHALSFAQQRQWFLWQMAPQDTAYHIAGTLHLSGQVDARAVGDALRAIVDRHESLRTAFVKTEDGEVRQCIRDDVTLDVPVVDLRGTAQAAQARALKDVLGQVHETPFDLGRAPLMRAALVRHGRDQHALAVVVHHIVSDGWSMQVIVDEFASAYQAFAAREPWRPAPLPVRYVDYAAWQRDRLDDGERARQLAWWRAHLGDEHPVLELHADHPRTPSAQYRARRHEVAIPDRLVTGLRSRAREHGTTLFTILLGAFQALLHLHTRQQDVRVGVPVTNRGLPETEGMVGFFVNAQVVRNEIGERATLAQILRQAREAVHGAQANQDLPFEQLIEALQPGRDLSHSPLFRIVMNHQRVDHGRLHALPGIRFDGLSLGEQTAQFELALDTTERPDGSLSARFTCADALFEPDTIARLATHYLLVLDACAHRADLAVGDLDWVDDGDKARLLQASRPHAPARPDRMATLHGRIGGEAALRPEAIAIVDGERRISYGELDRRANRLAHRLRDAGVRPESRVGLAMERSAELIVAMLAILKAGAAYVPLDPDYPADRLAYMMDDSQVALVLTRTDIAPRLPTPTGLRTLCVDQDSGGMPADADFAAPHAPIHGDSLAYVIYTSGSTGKPKGALLSHHNVIRLLDATAPWFHFDHHDVWTLFHSYAFDFSVWEIFGALCHGGRLVIVPACVSRAPDEFAMLLRDEGVTVLNQTPSAFRQLMQAPDLRDAPQGRGRLPALKTVVFGGEALEPDDLKPWMDRFGDAQPRLVNMYGITETTVHVTHRRITLADLGHQRSPIGGAMPDLGMYVLDERLDLVPPNVPGELHVSGEGLARGYLGRAALSAQRFVANPFEDGGARLYRTGDLARRTAGGQIEYLGRIDHQVKVRGYRIELGEIESRLRESPEVRDAVVVAADGPDGARRLVAYVVPGAGDDAAGQASPHAADTVVNQWESVFDSTYAGTSQAPDFRGWNSSFTDQPIPEAQMREWLDETVRRIEALKARAILEIGCGVGLLVDRLARGAQRYLGTDLSPRAVADLRAWIATQPALSHVELRQRQATDLAGIKAGVFDTMVLNSVAQYFPDVDYFVQTLRGAARIVGPRGRLFIGDLRHTAHLPLFHAAVQLFKAEPGATMEQLRPRVARAIAQEKELVIDPALFQPLAAHLGLGEARVMLRRGLADNELTAYRYDVVMGADASAPPAGQEEDLAWEALDGANDGDMDGRLKALASLLASRPWATLTVRGIPNRRLARDLRAWASIRDGDARTTARMLRGELACLPRSGVDPQALWDLAARHGHEVSITWSTVAEDAAKGRFDACFCQPAHASALAPRGPIAARDMPDHWRAWATHPATALRLRELPTRLKAGLQKHLPSYMVPATYVLLDALPLTPSGKLDRRALPKAETGGSQDAYEAPAGEIEAALSAIWTDVLGLDTIGRKDNFFDLGGHSLLATQVISRLRARLGVELPLRTVFEWPVLRDLAAHIAQQRGSTPPASAQPPLAPARRSGHMPLSPMQRRLWLVDRLAGHDKAATRAAYNMAVALKLEGVLDAAALQAALEDVVRRHEVLRTVYPVNDDGDPVALISPDSRVAMATKDLTQTPSGEQDVLVNAALAEQGSRVFDLARGPLLRTELLRLAAQRHVLLLCVHHIAFDGWSTSVFTSELARAYGARAEGRANAHQQPLPVQYTDYAVWHEALLARRASADAAYWRDALRDAPAQSSPAPDAGIEARPDEADGMVQAAVPTGLSQAVRALARRAGTSPFTVLLAVFQLWMHQRTGAGDLVLGTDVAGRHHPDLEQLIGFFVNVVPLRSRLDGDMPFDNWLSRVDADTQAAFAHQDVPFDQIVELSEVPRLRGRPPLVQVLFVMQNAPQGRFELPGLTVTRLPASLTHSKFDLALFVREERDGFALEWVHATNRHARANVERFNAEWQALLTRIVATPQAPVGPALSGPHPGKETPMTQPATLAASPISTSRASKLDKLRQFTDKRSPRQATEVPAASGEPTMKPLSPDRLLPIVIDGAASAVDPVAWARANRDRIESLLLRHGGILLRNFGLRTPQDFEAFAEAIEPELYGGYGDLPKKEGGRNTYRSTPYPERQMILYHNESAHLDRWPRKQWFFCELPSPVGGATPIVDCREMIHRLPADLVDEFERKGLLYVRTFTRRLDVSWQDFYQTDDRAAVEARLAAAGIGMRWLPNDELQTRTRCPAVITHPLTKERVFFNQVQLHHIGCLDPELREDLLSMVGLARIPRHVYFGDGSPISDDAMALVGRAYEACAVRFDWRQGDVIMLDNMLAAHARDPYEGPRKIVVAMGAMFDRRDLADTRHASAPSILDTQ